MNTYVIGDIHGEYYKLIKLLKNLKDIKKIIFLGDYINKGEHSEKVIEFLINLKNLSKYETVFLIGDHEYKLLTENLYFLKKNGGEYLFNSYISSFDVTKENYKKLINDMKNNGHYNFLTDCKLYYEDEEYIYLHSGYNTNLNCLEDVIKCDKLSILYSGYKFIKSQHLLNSKKVIFGHIPLLFPYVDNYKIGIDTGEEITAYCIEKEKFYNDKNEIYSLNDIKLKINKIMINK